MSTTAAYLVRRTAWEAEIGHPFLESTSWQGSYDQTTGTRHVAVTVFLTERDAKAEAYRLTQGARAGRSPFWFSHHLDEITDLSLLEVRARLIKKELAPPPIHPQEDPDESWRTLEVWQEWWDRECGTWTADQLADAWAVFPKLRFYEMVEIDLED